MSHPTPKAGQCSVAEVADEPEGADPQVPSYYQAGGIVAWDIIEAFKLGYSLGCALKYIVRAGRKTSDPREDLRKAVHCIEREIECIGRRS